jgi:hypothetical protein
MLNNYPQTASLYRVHVTALLPIEKLFCSILLFRRESQVLQNFIERSIPLKTTF